MLDFDKQILVKGRFYKSTRIMNLAFFRSNHVKLLGAFYHIFSCEICHINPEMKRCSEPLSNIEWWYLIMACLLFWNAYNPAVVLRVCIGVSLLCIYKTVLFTNIYYPPFMYNNYIQKL